MTDGESRISDADYDSLVRELRRPGGFLQRRPSVESLAWVAASLGRSSRVAGFRRLRGGVWSAVHRVTVERRGVRTFVVLRQYPGGFGLDADLKKEIANLGVVAGSGLPVPEVAHAEVHAADLGWPTIVAAAGIEPLLIGYDEIATDLTSVVELIANHVGVEVAASSASYAYERQADEATEEYILEWTRRTGGCELCLTNPLQQ